MATNKKVNINLESVSRRGADLVLNVPENVVALINLNINPNRIINITFPGRAGGLTIDTATQNGPVISFDNGTGETYIFPELPIAGLDPDNLGESNVN